MAGIVPTILRTPLELEQDREFILSSWILTTADPIGLPVSFPDYTDKVWTIGNAPSNSFGGTGVCSLKGSYSRPQFSTASGAVTHTYGTFANGTTNAAGYAIGSTSITLAAAGTGTLLAGDLINFGNDPTQYRVTAGLADISLGGAITLAAPGIAVGYPIPASATPFTSNASIGGFAYTYATSVIILNPAGTGTLIVGDTFTFAGDPTVYTVAVGDLDVSNGGNLTLRPTLVVPLGKAGVAITVGAATSTAVVLNKVAGGTAATAAAAAVITTVENPLWVYPELTTVGVAATVTVRLLARRNKLLRS